VKPIPPAPRPSGPTPQRRGASDTAYATGRLIDNLREAARASGLEPGDPMTPLVEAMALAIAELEDQRIKAKLTTTETVRLLSEILREGRETADAEIARFRAGLARTEASTIKRIAESIAKAADAALGRRVRAFDRRTAAAVAFLLIFSSGGCFWAGIGLGYKNAQVMIAETESGLRAAFSAGPEAAALWLDLMSWNDPRTAVLACTSPDNSFLQGGRRACRLPVWTERPAALNRS
jgi:hypothetical protein